MAVFRLHRKDWEKGQRPTSRDVRQKNATAKEGDLTGDDDDEASVTQQVTGKGKRKRGERTDKSETFPGGGRKGVSSGKSVVIRRRGEALQGHERKSKVRDGGRTKRGQANWWSELASGE
jgi:RNA exonuclease 4